MVGSIPETEKVIGEPFWPPRNSPSNGIFHATNIFDDLRFRADIFRHPTRTGRLLLIDSSFCKFYGGTEKLGSSRHSSAGRSKSISATSIALPASWIPSSSATTSCTCNHARDPENDLSSALALLANFIFGNGCAAARSLQAKTLSCNDFAPTKTSS